MEKTPFLMYSFMDPTFYENIDLYNPTDDYISIVKQGLSATWDITGKGFWTRCHPPGWIGSTHGWKIHVSSTAKNAKETIEIVTRELSKSKVSFKFCSDQKMLKLSLSKSWSRFQTGKFITIYPESTDQFIEVIELLHQATTHLSGPHILTDRAYKDSKVIYYRYGAHIGEYKIDPYGNRIPGFTLDNGTWCEDIRGPSFILPEGCADPFLEKDKVDSIKGDASSNIVLQGRYSIHGALKFNANGGIYYGVDNRDGRGIVIREVRGLLGHLEEDMPDDPAYILKREAAILKKLSPTGLVPSFIDIFKEWNNWFLVEERLEAMPLWDKAMTFYYSHGDQSSNDGLEKLLAIIKAIAIGLETIHANGVVLRDLTRNNVMITDERRVKFIDFEFAFELSDTGKWIRGWTAGYASAEQLSSQRPTFEDDYYALGALILDMITFCAAGLDLDRDSQFEKLIQVLKDLNFPMELYDLVTGLTKIDPKQRWNLQKVIQHLEIIKPSKMETRMFPSIGDPATKIHLPKLELTKRLVEITSGLQDFFYSSLDFSRSDRLWPSSPEMFQTNPVSLEHGATGGAWFLLQSGGHLDERILDWIEQRARATQCPPGLYSGLGGVALLLMSSGRVDSARKLLNETNKNRQNLIFEVPGLYFGSAGWGLINLHFWIKTGKNEYLENAIYVGNWLLDNARDSHDGLYWLSGSKTYLGLGDGQSGIALFLTYLGSSTGDARFFKAASLALDFDIAHSVRIAGRMVWKTHVDSKENEPNVPHTRFGSAGVGTACIRFFAATGNDKYRDVALDCASSVRTRITNKIWQDSGNAGYGEFLLDMQYFLGDEIFRDIAYYHSEAILPHAIKYPNGFAFAGLDHFRICSDYSTGGAGVGIFLDRLLNGRKRFLMLDDLLKESR